MTTKRSTVQVVPEAALVPKKPRRHAAQKRTFHLFIRPTVNREKLASHGMNISDTELALIMQCLNISIERVLTDARKVVDFMTNDEAYKANLLIWHKFEQVIGSRAVPFEGIKPFETDDYTEADEGEF